MSDPEVVYVGGEACKLVTIGELCNSYENPQRPDWMSDAPPTKKHKVIVMDLDSGTHILPEQSNTGTDEETNLPDTDGSDKDSYASDDKEVVHGSMPPWKECQCRQCLLQAFNKREAELLSPVEKVALDAESTAALNCTEVLTREWPTEFCWTFTDSKHLYGTEKIVEAWQACTSVSSCDYRDKWPRTGYKSGNTYPMDDGRFCRYRKYTPYLGVWPTFDMHPLTAVICSDDLFKWKRSPWIRQIGSLLVCEESEDKSEAVMVYNVHHAKTAILLITRAMESRHCMMLQQYMTSNVPYMIEFGSFTYPTPDYNEMMMSRVCGMLAYCHFCAIGDDNGWECGRMSYTASITANALPRDSVSVFADLDLDECYDVVQSGLWDVLPTDVMKKEMYAMMYKYYAINEHPETLINLFKSVNIDDDYDDGYTLSAVLPIDSYVRDKCESSSSDKGTDHIAEYLGNNDIFIDNYLNLCKEWQTTVVLAFTKNMDYTKTKEFVQPEDVVDHCLSLMVAWQTSVYGLIGCAACRLPVSHRFSNFHWMCGCRVYDFLAHAVQEYVDSISPGEDDADDSNYLEHTDKEDYFKFMQRWIEIKMAKVLN